MAYPIRAAIIPPSVVGQTNGRLTAPLFDVGDGSHAVLAAEALTAYRRLVDAALYETGCAIVVLGRDGAYRSFDRQVDLFLSRYETPPRAGAAVKVWRGVRYSLRAHMATAAVPGTSNHGYAAAVDVATPGPVPATPYLSITSSPAWPWLLARAVDFGWSWELQSEPWHLHLTALAPDHPNDPGDDDVPRYFRVASHPADIYAVGPPSVYISGPQGAILEAESPGWAADAKTIELAEDVDATLPRG